MKILCMFNLRLVFPGPFHDLGENVGLSFYLQKRRYANCEAIIENAKDVHVFCNVLLIYSMYKPMGVY